MTFGPWMMRVMRVLAGFKGLRGGALDIFGRTEERRMERRMIGEYEATIAAVLAELKPENHDIATAIAALPQSIRGFGHIKEANAAKAAVEGKRLMDAFRAPAPAFKTAAE